MSIVTANPRLTAPLLSILKTAGVLLAFPFLLLFTLAALIAVLIDFACFRIHATLTGELHPKGLWEF